jgi:hypothetical protein
MPAVPTKETLYIDAEDEITAIIEKVVTAKPKIVAVVLPKHATVFQSSVNLKLLQKAASNAKKNIVLITSDKSIIAISAGVGMMVAKTPTSKPSVPVLKKEEDKVKNEVNEKSPLEDNDSKSDLEDDDDSIQLDNTAEEDPASLDESSEKKKKLLRIPDFSSFRIKMALGLILVSGLVVFWIFGFIILPRATITINTDIKKSTINSVVTAKVGEVELDLENNTIQANRLQVEKIDSLTVPATGEKNIGAKATGLMNLENCINDGEDKIVPAGTSFSSGSQTFVTTEAVTLKFAIFAGNNCLSADFDRDKDVPVIASQAGPEYNLGAKSYNSSLSGINAFGSEMTGGTTELITVISAEDVEKATQELTGTSKNAALEEMKTQFESDGLRPIVETLTEGTPNVVASPAIDTEASEVKVTRTITYSLYGLSDSDISQIIENEVKKDVEEQQQNVRDSGLDSIVFQVLETPNESERKLGIQTVVTLGPDIDTDKLKNDVIGKKRGEIEKLIEEIDGVKSVSVEYSPVWITTTPKSTEKIDITFNENSDGQ